MQLQKEITDRLCKNTIFEGLTPEQIGRILPCIAMSIQEYNTDECVWDKGEPVNNLGVVLHGELCVCSERDGKRTTLQNIEANQLLGESVLLSTQQGLPHRVIAEKDAKILFLAGDFFMNTCDKTCDLREEHQVIVKNMLRILSDKAVSLGKKVAYLTANDLRTKIAMYLCELYEISRSKTFTMPLNRDRLADFFSVARPSLSRELTGLKNDGVINFHRSSVEILDLEKLYSIAEAKE